MPLQQHVGARQSAFRSSEDMDPENLSDNDLDIFDMSYGRFMRAFGSMEQCLNTSYRQFIIYYIYANRDGTFPIATRLIAPQRLAPLKDSFKRAFKVLGMPDETNKELDRVLAQVAEIHYLRDTLAHNQIFPAMPITRIPPLFTVNKPHLGEVISLDHSILDDATEDLTNIPLAIDYVLYPDLGILPLEADRLAFVYQAWRYKSSRLLRQRQEYRPTSRSRPLLPPSFHK